MFNLHRNFWNVFVIYTVFADTENTKYNLHNNLSLLIIILSLACVRFDRWIKYTIRYQKL